MDQLNVNDNDSQLDFNFPMHYLELVPAKEKDKLIHRLIMMWGKDEVWIDQETTHLCFSKTGTNKFRKLLVDLVNTADFAAKKFEDDIAKMGSAADDTKKEKTVEDRLKDVGLVSLTAKTPRKMR
jgi:hypothetical protein